MPGRKGLFLVILPLLLAAIIAGGYFALRRPAASPSAFACGGVADACAEAAARRHGMDPAGAAEGANGRDPGSSSELMGVGPDVHGEEGDKSKAGDESTPISARRIMDPDTANEALPGWLLVRVLNRDGDGPVPGAMVYLPVFSRSLALERGEITVPAEIASRGRLTNTVGAAVFSARELAESGGADISVLATCSNFVDHYEPFAMPDVGKGAEVVIKLCPGARVAGKARLKKGGPAALLDIAVLQSSRHDPNAPPRNALAVKTDNNGEFTLKVASEYLYQFVVDSVGYAPYRSAVFDFKRGEREVSIVLEQARGIAGTVGDANGAAIKGARVEMLGEGGVSITDDLGQFAFDCVRDAIYSNEVTLRTTAAGCAPDIRKVLVNDRNVRIALMAQGSLHGVVKSQDKAVKGATVSCVFLDGPGEWPIGEMVTLEDGVFGFTGFGRGRARLVAKAGDMTCDPLEVAVEPVVDLGPVNIELRPAARVMCTLNIDGGGVVAGATVQMDGGVTGVTNDKGQFDFGPVASGEHSVKVVQVAPIEDEAVAKLPVFSVDGKVFYYLPVAQKTKLEIGAQANINFWVKRFEVKVHRDISVRVVGRANEDTKGIKATLKPVLGEPPKGTQRPQPQDFTFDLANSIYELKLQLVDGMSYEVTFEHARYLRTTLKAETLKDLPDGASIDVTLERAFIIKGYVKDGDGNGLEGVGISRDKGNVFNFAVTTDIHGYFEIGQLKGGDYVISAFKTTYYLEQKSVRAAGADPEPLQFQLIGANEIRLIVIDDGQRRPGARIHVYRNENDKDKPDAVRAHFDIGTTDAEGVKVINFHWTRNYQVVAIFEQRIACVNFDNLRDVPAREFTLTMEPAFKFTGRVVDASSGQGVPDIALRAHVESGAYVGNYFQTRADAAGNFSLMAPAGRYYFFVPQTRIYRGLDTSETPVIAPVLDVVLALTLRDDIEGNWAQIISFSTPLTMSAGQEYDVSVVVRNAGGTNWSAAGKNPWRLGSQAAQDNKTWGFGRVNIAQSTLVRPGENYVFTFKVRAPVKAGVYAMQWRMVQENVEWFGDYTALQNVTVTKED
ncbi:MAG: hypothetical protein IT462_14685 [Planctomycetes bacterium]|nr:hypothetical protein [Planctomycetota bacterium]